MIMIVIVVIIEAILLVAIKDNVLGRKSLGNVILEEQKKKKST